MVQGVIWSPPGAYVYDREGLYRRVQSAVITEIEARGHGWIAPSPVALHWCEGPPETRDGKPHPRHLFTMSVLDKLVGLEIDGEYRLHVGFTLVLGRWRYGARGGGLLRMPIDDRAVTGPGDEEAAVGWAASLAASLMDEFPVTAEDGRQL